MIEKIPDRLLLRENEPAFRRGFVDGHNENGRLARAYQTFDKSQIRSVILRIVRNRLLQLLNTHPRLRRDIAYRKPRFGKKLLHTLIRNAVVTEIHGNYARNDSLL